MVKIKNFAAVLQAQGEKLTIEERPVPTPEGDEILIRNDAVALNPLDWKQQDWGIMISSYPTILGCDIAGEVVAVGSKTAGFKTGDRVIAYTGVLVAGPIGGGAFQNYTIAKAITTAKLPDNVSAEEGAIIPVGIVTASVALFEVLGIPLPTADAPPSQSSAILVWGGSSSVGSNTVQLAHQLGYTVFTTASPAHHEYLRSLGATVVVDYNSPNAVADLIAAAKKAGKPIRYAVDAISEAASLQPTAEVLEKTGEGKAKLVIVLDWADSVPRPKDVEIVRMMSTTILNEVHIANWLFKEFLPTALEKGTFVASPGVQIVEGGLEGLQAGLDTLRKGVSGKKLVIKLAE